MQYLARGAAEPCAIPAGPRCGIRRLNGFGGVLKIDALTRRRLETGRNGQRWLSRGLKNAVDLAIWVTEGSQLSVQKRWRGARILLGIRECFLQQFSYLPCICWVVIKKN